MTSREWGVGTLLFQTLQNKQRQKREPHIQNTLFTEGKHKQQNGRKKERKLLFWIRKDLETIPIPIIRANISKV